MSKNKPVWLEVALNGAAGKAFQPNIPIAVQEIVQQGVDCAKAGAAIVHVHAYDDQGRGVEDADIYSAIIEGIKNQIDVIVYPTLSLAGSLEERYAPIQTLIDRGLLEAGVIDPGSVNITHMSQLMSGQSGIVYPNPDSHIKYGLQLAEQYGWRPAYAIYEPGFARLGAAFAGLFPNLLQPVYRIMLSDNLLFGMRPSARAVQLYAEILSELVPQAPWMLSGLDADVTKVMPQALELGAHVRVGLEDAPFGTSASNLELVEHAVSVIAQQSRPLATVADVRAHS